MSAWDAAWLWLRGMATGFAVGAGFFAAMAIWADLTGRVDRRRR